MSGTALRLGGRICAVTAVLGLVLSWGHATLEINDRWGPVAVQAGLFAQEPDPTWQTDFICRDLVPQR